MHINRSIKLELLRHGPPHNQLLSPLTQYLGLSGSHEACTVKIPYEHKDFLLRLEALDYQSGSESRSIFLKEISQAMGDILAKIPGLTADLSNNNECSDGLIHLRLVFSASELSMLPFEMSKAPCGFPGEGLPISLQLEAPLVMTREIRSARGFCVRWDRKPKILFASASPLVNGIRSHK